MSKEMQFYVSYFLNPLQPEEFKIQDEIDNQIYNLLTQLAWIASGRDKLKWDIDAISKIRDVALTTLKENYNITLIYP